MRYDVSLVASFPLRSVPPTMRFESVSPVPAALMFSHNSIRSAFAASRSMAPDARSVS
jgi:hypothetical protein